MMTRIACPRRQKAAETIFLGTKSPTSLTVGLAPTRFSWILYSAPQAEPQISANNKLF